jgi:hypothetical protein
MKGMLIKLLLLVVMVAAIVALILVTVWQSKEIARLRENFITEVNGERDVQQTITKDELKKLFSEEVEKLKEYGIKPRQVENVINVEYHYIDTLRYRDTLVWVYDTSKKSICTPFSVSAECYTIDGEIVGDTLEITRHTSNDEILVSLYKEKRKCIFSKRRVKAIAISACKGDTLSVIRNLKIGR